MDTLKIFVVDDDIYYLHLFQQHLLNIGYEQISLFENGTDCLKALNEKPDIIFLDHNMDTMSGYEVLKKIKRFDPNMYVVMVSGQEDIKSAVDALKHGAFDYIQKGDDEMTKIKDVIVKIIEVRELLQQSKPGLIKKFFQFIL